MFLGRDGTAKNKHMKITLLCIGKTDEVHLVKLMQKYEKRLPNYINYERIELPDLKNSKNLSEIQQKSKEGELILSRIEPVDYLVLLDEKGKQFTSRSFSDELQNYMNQSVKHLVFVIGGPYGFDESVYERANKKISLSSMTFTHQMARLFLIEQIYRAFTILQGKPYHHE